MLSKTLNILKDENWFEKVNEYDANLNSITIKDLNVDITNLSKEEKVKLRFTVLFKDEILKVRYVGKCSNFFNGQPIETKGKLVFRFLMLNGLLVIVILMIQMVNYSK